MSLYDLIIRNGTVVTAEGVSIADVAVADGSIVAAGNAVVGGTYRLVVARVLSNGQADASLSVDGVAEFGNFSSIAKRSPWFAAGFGRIRGSPASRWPAAQRLRRPGVPD